MGEGTEKLKAEVYDKLVAIQDYNSRIKQIKESMVSINEKIAEHEKNRNGSSSKPGDEAEGE